MPYTARPTTIDALREDCATAETRLEEALPLAQSRADKDAIRHALTVVRGTAREAEPGISWRSAQLLRARIHDATTVLRSPHSASQRLTAPLSASRQWPNLRPAHAGGL